MEVLFSVDERTAVNKVTKQLADKELGRHDHLDDNTAILQNDPAKNFKEKTPTVHLVKQFAID